MRVNIKYVMCKLG